MTNKLTPEEALAALRGLKAIDSDKESQHVSADVILYKLLNFYGQEEVTAQYTKMMQDWWYA